MNRCAVVIGVNKTGNLPILQAAVSGAKDFADWAEKTQHMDVTLLTDENGGSVTLSQIKAAISQYVKSKKYTQLFVFFSGHGVLKAQGSEIWLLSNAPDDPDEAVNVTGSMLLARNCGTPHVVIISDACRSLPTDTRFQQMNGGVIFPNLPPDKTRPEVDVFYSTLPGDPALELPTQDAAKSYRGIFTECLLNGLKPVDTSLITDIGDKDLQQTRPVILCRTMKQYLYKQVPRAAFGHNIQLHQDPDIRIESDVPNFLGEVVLTSPLTKSASPLPKEQPQAFNQILSTLTREMNEEGARDEQTGGLSATQMVDAMSRISTARGRESFETRTGFTVIGAPIRRAVVTDSGCDIFTENEAEHVRVHLTDTRERSALIQFSDGTGLPLAVLPGFIGTIVLEKGHVVSVTYRPSRGTPKFWDFDNYSGDLEARRAYIAVASKSGQFRIETIQEAKYAGNFLRIMKALDPTMGLYAAYAYLQAGDFDSIESVYSFMTQEQEPVLFDIALLAGGISGRSFSSDRQVPLTRHYAPFCPMLTQGWLYLEPFNTRLDSLLEKAARYLVPGLWTTFRPDITDELFDNLPATISAFIGHYVEQHYYRKNEK